MIKFQEIQVVEHILATLNRKVIYIVRIGELRPRSAMKIRCVIQSVRESYTQAVVTDKNKFKIPESQYSTTQFYEINYSLPNVI